MVAVPEHFRCRRSDGKQWRCARRAKDGFSFCELHHLQARRRQCRKPVPDSLKLPRRRRSDTTKANLRVAAPPRRLKKGRYGDRKDGQAMKGKKGRRKVGNGELAMELVGMVLRQMLQRREEKEKRKREAAAAAEKREKGAAGDALRAAAPGRSLGNAGEPMNQKLVLNSSSFLRWCFRSKNVERPPLVASVQTISSGRGIGGSKKRRKGMCQLCQESYRNYLVRCSSCKKVLFCRTCVKRWCPDMAETQVKVACPICLGTRHDTKNFAVKCNATWFSNRYALSRIEHDE